MIKVSEIQETQGYYGIRESVRSGDSTVVFARLLYY
jgi:hypothetical protein